MPDASLNDAVKANVDVFEGDEVIIVGEGEFIELTQQDKSVRTRLKIPITLPRDGATKPIILNETTRKALIEGFGKNTADWVGKAAAVSVVKQNVGGTMKDVTYLTPVIRKEN